MSMVVLTDVRAVGSTLPPPPSPKPREGGDLCGGPSEVVHAEDRSLPGQVLSG